MTEKAVMNGCLNYFYLWNKNDISKLVDVFTTDVELWDWEIHETGRDNVLKANNKIFESVKSVAATPKTIAINNMKAFCEIEVVVRTLSDGIEILDVVDVITFAWGKESLMIKSIHAYKK